jgi:hypothetical protein
MAEAAIDMEESFDAARWAWGSVGRAKQSFIPDTLLRRNPYRNTQIASYCLLFWGSSTPAPRLQIDEQTLPVFRSKEKLQNSGIEPIFCV